MHGTGDRFGAEWTIEERSEYGALGVRRGAGGETAVPALVRECLLAMHEESPEDEDLKRALEATPSA